MLVVMGARLNKIFRNKWLYLFVMFFFITISTFSICGCGDGDGKSDQAGGVDTEPPTTPTNLTATAVSSSQIDLTWNASTDNVGVTEYRAYIFESRGNFSEVCSVTSTSCTVENLDSDSYRCFVVLAYDAAGNVSGMSNTACATTLSDAGNP
jgi:hypothetical protein